MSAKISLEEKFVFNAASFNNMVAHVFLPRKLGDGFDPRVHAAVEEQLLALMAEVVLGFDTNLPTSTRKLFESMNHLQRTMEIPDVATAISGMQPGEMFGLYVPAQNCGILLHLPSEQESNRVTLATFPASLPNELILGSPNEIQVGFCGNGSRQISKRLCFRYRSISRTKPSTFRTPTS